MTACVVVTGASGFVGRAVCRVLVDRGVDVVGVARRPLDPLVGMTAVLVERYADAPAPDGSVCLHLAGESVPSRLTEEGVATALSDARALREKSFRRVVLASSAAVYGNTEVPAREDAPLAPRGPYAELKMQLERVFGSTHAVARLSNVYGPGQSPASVLSSILTQLRSNGPLTLRALSPIRDFLFVADAAEGLASLCLSAVTGPVNISSGRGTSIAELARVVLQLAGQATREVVVTAEEPTPSSLVLDPTHAARSLGWRATTSLEAGLTATLGKAT